MLFQECERCKTMKPIEESKKKCMYCGRLMCSDCHDETQERCNDCEDCHYSAMIYSCDWDD